MIGGRRPGRLATALERPMSRAFVKEDDYVPPRRFTLPEQDDPAYDAAAAAALIEAARDGVTSDAEAATGYRWGDAALQPYVRLMLEQEESRPEPEQDRRLMQVARRFLRQG
jgi:hypothetical protein